MPHYSLKDANFRVFLNQRQGGRKYMEDVVMIRDYKSDKGDHDFVFWAVFDGHGGVEAARFAREHLLEELQKLRGFWTTDPDEVTRAIKEAFVITHRLMWKNVGKWPRTLSGLPSTAGTTASVVLIKNGKVYVAHVGDSSIVIGEEKTSWQRYIANCITVDHKPEDPFEKKRIEESGGQVVAKAGVQRVVWHRPKPTHKGPVRRSTRIDDIPFLAVARALGDLWSYNSERDTFVVSPEPDIAVMDLDSNKQKFIILASDGLWNMVKPDQAVALVEEMDERDAEKFNGAYNPAIKLVSLALDKWASRNMRADNTSVIMAFVDPPGKDPSPLSHTSQLSNASTVNLSDTESIKDIQKEESPYQKVASPNFPGINRHRYWDDLFPSPRNIGFGGRCSVKHIHAVTGKTPKFHKQKHYRTKTPKSCPPKMHSTTSDKANKLIHSKSAGNPVHGIPSDYLCSSMSSSYSYYRTNINGASPLLAIKGKASTEQAESLISKISPLQGTPIKRKSSDDTCPASTKKPRRNSPYKVPITDVLDNDYVSQEVIVSTSDEVNVGSELSQIASVDTEVADTPMVGVSVRSPLKVDTQQNSPSLAVVSPIWPSCLEKDIDLDPAGSSDLCRFTASDTTLCHSVLRENSPKAKVASVGGIVPKKTSYARNSKKLIGSQNKMLRAGIFRRRTPQVTTRITVHKLRLRSKRTVKLRTTQHRTRLQVDASGRRS